MFLVNFSLGSLIPVGSFIREAIACMRPGPLSNTAIQYSLVKLLPSSDGKACLHRATNVFWAFDVSMGSLSSQTLSY